MRSTPDEPILFGILHCIAVASLIAALFVAAPPWAALVVGAAAVAAPFVYSSAAFNPPALVWLGLGTVAPYTLDWRPLLPWAGVVLIGLGLTQAAAPRLSGWRWTAWRPTRWPGRAAAFAGRHSLVIYLVHQPILFGLLWSVVTATGLDERHAREAYLAACPPACVSHGGDVERLRQGLRLRRRPRRGRRPVAQRGARRRRRRIAAAAARRRRDLQPGGAVKTRRLSTPPMARVPDAIGDRADKSALLYFVSHSCAGSLWKRHMRFGPAMTLR